MLVPQFLITAFNWFISEPAIEVVITHSRKKPDRTKLNLIQIDFIRHKYNQWKDGLYPELRTQKDLTSWLNEALDLDKGVTAYAKIWSPKIPEEVK